MRITQHAKDKYGAGRTRTRPEDITAMLDSGLGIELGVANGYRYVYFYSLQDDGGKIAVVSDDAQTLVSIWGGGYTLPKEVRKPTHEDLLLARKRLLDWLDLDWRFRKRPVPADTEGSLVLLVFEGSHVEFRHELPVTYKQVITKWKMIDLVKPELRVIAMVTKDMPNVEVRTQFVSRGTVHVEHVIDRHFLDRVLEHWLTKQSKIGASNDLARQGTLRLVVFEGTKVEYEKEISTTLAEVDTKYLATSLLSNDLAVIARATDGMRSVRVQVRFFVDDVPIRKYRFSREELDGLLTP